MMKDVFALIGRFYIKPPAQSTEWSGDFFAEGDLDEKIPLTLKSAKLMQLTVDGATVVSFDGLATAGVVYVKVDQPVTLTISSTLGTNQTLPLDDLWIHISQSVQISALSITRTSGVLTNCRVVLGQP